MKRSDRDSLIRRIDELEGRLTALQKAGRGRGVRRRATRRVAGWPLWEIAVGPDMETGEVRGHARAVFAVGDLATGIVAVGGFARGIVAIGGLALGVFGLAGFSVGLLVAVGGVAAGSAAFGGAAFGYVAVGGLAAGYYACGGLALGTHVISAGQQDPEAVRFFTRHLPWLKSLFLPPRGG